MKRKMKYRSTKKRAVAMMDAAAVVAMRASGGGPCLL
jgi:hypothetical protein